MIVAAFLLFPVFVELKESYKKWAKNKITKVEKKNIKIKSDKAFTLIELLVVLAITGILLSVLFTAMKEKGNDTTSCYDQKTECLLKCSNQYDECRVKE
ncbi:MAG: type II secretion system protein [Methanogenium sp.]|jgi:prepilin-type N-terminal cleavage/methylation domain-containing protein